MISAVPPQGNNAASPGNKAACEKPSSDTAMAASPRSEAAFATHKKQVGRECRLASRARGHCGIAARLFARGLVSGRGGVVALRRNGADHLWRCGDDEIGRASCRERA